jgi:predicted transcriptional regulator
MAILQKILSSRVRSEIFRLLFGLSDRQLHIREMERRTGLSVATVRQELQKLLQMQLVEAQRSGNRLYYRANTSHPLYTDIRNIVLKTSGMVDILRDALDKEDVKIAFVFGSVVSNQEGATH